MSSHQPLQLGQILHQQYRIIQALGSGGFGCTYLAENIDQPDSLKCVVKHLRPASSDPGVLQTARRLFQAEAETLKTLGHHDQIPQLLDAFEEDEEFYLVQEFIDGQLLGAALLPNQLWSEDQVVELLQDVLSILAFVHHYGVIHRDLKPDNLIRRKHDNKLVLIDFGSVKQIQTQLVTPHGHLSATVAVGTPGYISSEQGQGKPRPNSDIYSLGLIAIQSLTGIHPAQLPDDAQTGEKSWRQQAQISDGLAFVLDKMVRYHHKDRYQSVAEAQRSLQQALDGLNPDLSSAAQTASLTQSTASSSNSALAIEAQNSVGPPSSDSTANLDSTPRSSRRSWPLILGSVIIPIAIAAVVAIAGARGSKPASDPQSASAPSPQPSASPVNPTPARPSPRATTLSSPITSSPPVQSPVAPIPPRDLPPASVVPSSPPVPVTPPRPRPPLPDSLPTPTPPVALPPPRTELSLPTPSPLPAPPSPTPTPELPEPAPVPLPERSRNCVPHLNAFKFVHECAYSGSLAVYKIPGGSSLTNAYNIDQITAEAVIQAGIDAGLLSPETLDDRSFRNAVDRHLGDL